MFKKRPKRSLRRKRTKLFRKGCFKNETALPFFSFVVFDILESEYIMNLNYYVESMAFINEAYGLLDDAKHNPESFKPYRWRALAYPYCLVLSKDDWKLTLCTRTVTRCITNDITYEKVYTLTNNQQVHELLGVYINCLEKRKEDTKKNDYCEAAVEFTRAACRLLDICRDPGAGDTIRLSDGNHMLSLRSHSRELVLSHYIYEKEYSYRCKLGTLYLDDSLDISELLAKYLDSLKEHAWKI